MKRFIPDALRACAAAPVVSAQQTRRSRPNPWCRAQPRRPVRIAVRGSLRLRRRDRGFIATIVKNKNPQQYKFLQARRRPR